MTKWYFQIFDQHPSSKSLLQTKAKGRAKQSFNFFKMPADILSCPVAFFSSSFLNKRLQTRVRKDTKQLNSSSGMPKKGTSTTSGGKAAFSEKLRAKVSALAFASVIQVFSFFKDGIDV